MVLALGIQLQRIADEGIGTPYIPTAAVPIAPANLVGVGASRRVSLSWDRVIAYPFVQNYEYRVSVDGGSFSNWATLPGSGPSTTGHVFLGLVNGRPYSYDIRAVNAEGDGAAASVSNVRPSGAFGEGFSNSFQ